MKYAILIVLLIIGTTGILSAQEISEQFKAADQSLIVMPTAYTMPKGKQSFTDYELFLIQYAYGITDRTHISAGMVFPIVMDMFKTFTFGVKQNYYRGRLLQSAALVSYNPEVNGGVLGNVVSVGNPKVSAHLAAFWVTDMETISKNYAIMLGGIATLSPRFAVISEVWTSNQIFESDLNGIFLIGVRFKGENVSWDIGGFRPIQEDGGTILFLPMLKATMMF
jgi:hypothetical protein